METTNYVGLAPDPARALARQLCSWASRLDPTLRTIGDAESLIGESIGVTLTLDAIGRDGMAAGAAIDRAVEAVGFPSDDGIGRTVLAQVGARLVVFDSFSFHDTDSDDIDAAIESFFASAIIQDPAIINA